MAGEGDKRIGGEELSEAEREWNRGNFKGEGMKDRSKRKD